MKRPFITLLLAFALALVARAETKQVVIHGRTVAVTIEMTADTVATVQTALDNQLTAQGWHDHILRAQEGNKAFMVYSVRDSATAAATKSVQVVLWKAIAREGKTYTEVWTYTLPAAEVNHFLDTELPSVTEEFKTTPIQYTVTIS